MNRVINGVNELSAPLAGRTVADVRAMLAQALNIDPTAHAVANGDGVAEDYVLGEGDEVEFVKAAGEKG